MDYDIWNTVKNGIFVPPYQVNFVMENKDREIYTKEDK